MDRDIKPLIYEKKANWKIKINDLTTAKDKISLELVDLDIKLRNLEEEKKRLKLILEEDKSSLNESLST